MAEAVLKDEELKEFLNNLSGKLKDVSAYLKLAYATFGFRDIIQHFANEESPEGKWTPWSKTYKDFMTSIGKGGNKLLQDTGMMRQSISETSVKKIDSYSVSVFSNKVYSRAHDEGYKNIPQRQFMWFSDEGMTNMVTLLLNKLVEDKQV